jgi:selenocysteine lyase/cysteine desulfurase
MPSSALTELRVERSSNGQLALIDRIRSCVVGETMPLPGPFGPRRQLYADYVASGRAVSFIEDFIRDEILPSYGNTHSEMSFVGRRTTAWREWARRAAREATGASGDYAVLFTGAGATGGIDVLVRGMELYASPAAKEGLLRKGPRPVVFVGPYEHHSNDLPWRESLAEVVRIPLGKDGRLDLAALEALLPAYADRPLKVGAFSAASNVTGIRTDMRALARLLHRHRAILVGDYAAGAPYMEMSVGETAPGADDHIDAIVLSPHKFIGGPGASGLLVARRELFRCSVPAVSGGGTVSFVNAATHRYVRDVERREEGGTPNIVGNIRAGLVMQLKTDVGAGVIEQAERHIVGRIMAAWKRQPAIRILGPDDDDRIGIFSFGIDAGGKQLHHSFVVALLNDLFGIQARGGCSCAGPYGHELLELSLADSATLSGLVDAGYALMRPGWVRVGANYFFSDQTVAALIKAIAFIAERGWEFLSLYDVDVRSGNWTAKGACAGREGRQPPFSWLGAGRETKSSRDAAPDFEESLRLAHEIADGARSRGNGEGAGFPDAVTQCPLRWFWLPSELSAIREAGAKTAGGSIRARGPFTLP